MKRTKSGKAWMREHVTDPYVKQAKAQGYRSRSAFKLMEIDDKDRLIRPSEIVVDLGAAPGGWSQVAVERIKENGRVLAVDILEMEPIPGVEFIQGDFCNEEVWRYLEAILGKKQICLVMSDMAPNISGVSVSDQARMMHLAELGMDFSINRLKSDGVFLVKVFHGHGFDDFVRKMKQVFRYVSTRKPEASRDRSAETYMLGRGLMV